MIKNPSMNNPTMMSPTKKNPTMMRVDYGNPTKKYKGEQSNYESPTKIVPTISPSIPQDVQLSFSMWFHLV